MKSNFIFLEEAFPALAQIGSTAEDYLYSDTNSCLYKLGQFGEMIVNLMLKLDNISPPAFDNTHANRIRLLKKNGLLPKEIDDILYSLRTTRNRAVHENYDSFEDCKVLLEMAYNLAVWFMQTYEDWEYKPTPFVLPENKSNQADYESLLKEKEKLIKELTEQLERMEIGQQISLEDRAKQGNIAADKINLSEKETRYLIDQQLRKVGWEADTINLRYSKGTRPQKGRNIAIAEWPTDCTIGDRGYADYALFVGLRLVGIIEVKRKSVDIPSVIDYQCKDYAKGVKEEHAGYQVGTWSEYKVPFLFATNGRKYLRQLETKSGVWFLDARQRSNIPRALQGWMSPEGIMELLDRDIATANRTLEEMCFFPHYLTKSF